ncbi:hypothetical protein E2562_017538 [Oryza meyeriana var. granulata]|uniref:Uncharacterized protein n=1 Tax=Oryza meyeriana var. granulata TaxID=110450 RepID=A0A6G1C6U5_9ORYZ|nr:hypothetical protein E2562_017538 [Oryza meyeriana var. granulata]
MARRARLPFIWRRWGCGAAWELAEGCCRARTRVGDGGSVRRGGRERHAQRQQAEAAGNSVRRGGRARTRVAGERGDGSEAVAGEGTAVAGGRRRGLTGAGCGEGQTTATAFWAAWSRKDARVVMAQATAGSAVLGPLGAAGGAQPGQVGAAWGQYGGGVRQHGEQRVSSCDAATTVSWSGLGAATLARHFIEQLRRG